MLLMMNLGFGCLAAPSGPAVGGVPGQLSRQGVSLACSACPLAPLFLVLARRAALALVSVTPVCGFPSFPLVKGKHSKPSKETT